MRFVGVWGACVLPTLFTPHHRHAIRVFCIEAHVSRGLLWVVRWRAWERAVRFVVVWGAFVVLTLFYLIPIIAIQGLINIDQLRKIRVIAIIIDLPVVRSIITAILPGNVLRPVLLRMTFAHLSPS